MYTLKDHHHDDLFENIDLRDLAILILGEPEIEYENRSTYCCPFHDDDHPSAVIFKNRFYCSACGVNLNRYDFVIQATGSKSKNEMLNNLNEIFNLQ